MIVFMIMYVTLIVSVFIYRSSLKNRGRCNALSRMLTSRFESRLGSEIRIFICFSYKAPLTLGCKV